MASRRPHHMPACRHVEIGAQLQDIRDYLLHLSVELSHAYPNGSKQVKAADRAQGAVDELRNVLDSVSAGELPGEAWSPTIYYGANREVRETEVARVLDLHQMDGPACCAGEGR